MMHVLITILLLLTPVSQPVGEWHPAPGEVFDIRLMSPNGEIDPRVQVIELDVHDADARLVQQLSQDGVRTICYFSVGTWEEWRPDAAAFPQQVIGRAWPEWPGERYLDLRALDTLAPLTSARLDLCAEKGFAGVDPDNIDSWWADTGFPLTQADTERFLQWLIDAAHLRGLAIGQKNAPDLASAWHGHFDFAVTEDCAADLWCTDIAPYLAAGKPVYAIEYTDRTTAAGFRQSCSTFSAQGYALVLKNRDLDAPAVWCR